MASICPVCRKKIHFNGNTQFVQTAQSGKVTFGDIFSNVLKRHTQQEALQNLATPADTGVTMFKTWQRPWMFLRLFVFLFLLGLINYLAKDSGLNNPLTLSQILFSVSVPFAFALMLWEMNVHRNVTIMELVSLMLIGGTLSCLLAAPLNTKLDTLGWADYTSAPLVEENIKLLISVLFIVLFKRKKELYCLDGIVIGAAVAAGFAGIENIEYAFRYYASTNNMGFLRSFWGCLTGSHMFYTAPFVGALVYGMKGKRLKMSHFVQPLFLLFWALAMLFHGINNSGLLRNEYILFDQSAFELSVSSMQLLMIVPCWTSMLMILRLGYSQAVAVADHRAALTEDVVTGMMVDFLHSGKKQGLPVAKSTVKLHCLDGQFAGQNIPISGSPLIIGHDKDTCQLVLESGFVSRRHAQLMLKQGCLYVTDLDSSNGTSVNGTRLVPGKETRIKAGDILAFGSNSERFEIQ